MPSCPKCGFTLDDDGDIDADDGFYVCHNCGYQGTEVLYWEPDEED